MLLCQRKSFSWLYGNFFLSPVDIILPITKSLYFLSLWHKARTCHLNPSVLIAWGDIHLFVGSGEFMDWYSISIEYPSCIHPRMLFNIAGLTGLASMAFGTTRVSFRKKIHLFSRCLILQDEKNRFHYQEVKIPVWNFDLLRSALHGYCNECFPVQALNTFSNLLLPGEQKHQKNPSNPSYWFSHPKTNATR